MAYQDWLYKDHPSGWLIRYRRDGRGYEASQDGQTWCSLPSVTQITALLNKNLQDWAVRQVVEYLKGALVPGSVLTPEAVERIIAGASQAHRAAAQAAASRGTTLHAWAEAYLKGQNPPWPEEEPLRSMAYGLASWWQDNRGIRLLSEEVVFHPAHLYAGRVDLVASLGGRLMVLDLKTSARPYPEHLLQVGAYALALREEGIPVEGGLVLALREGLVLAEVPDGAAEAFLGLRRAFDFLQALS